MTYLKITLVGLMFILLQSCNKDNTIKIGVILPLSNSEISVGGKKTLNGIKLAVEKYNNENDNNISLIIEDSEANPTKGVNAINKLIFGDRVNYIIGDLTSGVTLAIAPIAEKNKIIVLAPGASSPDVKYAGDYIFRDWTSDDFEGSVAAIYTSEKMNWKNVVVLYINNDFGLGLSKVYETEFKKNGGLILFSESFNSGQTDYRSLIHKITNDENKSIDGIYLAGEPREMGHIIKQLKENNINIPIFSNASVEEKDFQTIALTANNTIYYASPIFNINDTTLIVSEFAKLYRENFNDIPDITSAHGYDAAALLLYSINKAGANNTELVKSELYNIDNFQGVTGRITFDSYGDAIKPIAIKRLDKNGSSTVEIFNPKK